MGVLRCVGLRGVCVVTVIVGVREVGGGGCIAWCVIGLVGMGDRTGLIAGVRVVHYGVVAWDFLWFCIVQCGFS